jgi:DNA repair photolyase
MENQRKTPKTGRGTLQNPTGRFEPASYFPDPDTDPEDIDQPSPRTRFFEDHSRSIITHNDSPDIGFKSSLNPYRGCEHGCIYCYARPTHEYFGLSAGLDFESRIMVKSRAAELLRAELASRRWEPQVLIMSGVTDPYQPVERHLKVTRACLEVLLECRNPVAIISKNPLVARDVDLLARMAAYEGASVALSVTSLDLQMAKRLEPRAGRPAHRLAAIETLAKAGVPVTVMVAPIIPGLTDHEMPGILKAAAEAGARSAGYTVLRLPYGVKDLFENWLGEHFPDAKEKVLGRIRDMRGGQLYDSAWGTRMKGQGSWAVQLEGLFDIACRKAGLNQGHRPLSAAHFRRPQSAGGQLELFG